MTAQTGDTIDILLATYNGAAFLEEQLRDGNRIYSASYIMPSGSEKGGRKHRFHLELLATMLSDDVPKRILDAPSLPAVYELLLSYPSVGPFLAYQWTIDLNYSP
ncbi:MAG: hypothetical protein IH804_04160, partial [Planctomycetes bacterium]|nr:hypothetical protein [Planctomycetota bacterium]